MDLNLENTKDFPLNEATLAQLLDVQHECTMTWTTQDSWPMAMVQLFLWRDGRIWTTTSAHKKRVHALRARPKSCIVVSGEGTQIGGDRSVAIKTTVTIHDDRATKDWFLSAIAAKMNPGDERAAALMTRLLDSPRRVVLEHQPVKFIGYDGIAMRDALIGALR
jgi:general stress protein 26